MTNNDLPNDWEVTNLELLSETSSSWVFRAGFARGSKLRIDRAILVALRDEEAVEALRVVTGSGVFRGIPRVIALTKIQRSGYVVVWNIDPVNIVPIDCSGYSANPRMIQSQASEIGRFVHSQRVRMVGDTTDDVRNWHRSLFVDKAMNQVVLLDFGGLRKDDGASDDAFEQEDRFIEHFMRRSC